MSNKMDESTIEDKLNELEIAEKAIIDATHKYMKKYYELLKPDFESGYIVTIERKFTKDKIAHRELKQFGTFDKF
jgi:hypothetical protein